MTWRLGRRPALDGMRAVAVAIVVTSHLSPVTSRVHLFGQVGVTVFFTLSGFLITALMLDERDRSGRVDVWAFYLRRARRLLPALLTMLAAATGVGIFVKGYLYPSTLVGSLSYSTNWVILAHNNGPFDPLAHTWSLAVEEQFYLVWPLMFIALTRLPGRWPLRLLVCGVIGTAFLPLTMTHAGFDRVYLGSDARAMPLLLGCLLAWLLHRSEVAPSRAIVATVALTGVLLTTRLGPYLMPQAVALLTTAAIWATVRGTGVRWLEHPALVLLGRRSYAVYLWHVPLIVLADRWLEGWTVALIVIPAVWVLATLSWRYVEQPVLSRGQTHRQAELVVG